MNEENTDINKRALFIFGQLFDMFSIDDEERPGEKIWKMQQVADFITKATNYTCHLNDTRVKDFFKYDDDNDDKLTK